MTTRTGIGPQVPAPVASSAGDPGDHRGSWVPTGGMITTRCMELWKRRGLMVTLVLVTIGIPTVFLAIRLILHAVAPHSYGPAGGYTVFTGLVVLVLYVFGFIVAATLGCTAGSVDLTEGMFRHLVVTGRSRLALYLARIPAGLAIIVPMVAVGFAVVCTVCVLAAPRAISYDGATIPAGLSRAGLDTWAADNQDVVFCDFPYPAPTPTGIPCGGPDGPGGSGGQIVISPKGLGPSPEGAQPTPAALRAEAVSIADQDYADYSRIFLYPSNSLMIQTGLWIELEAVVGFIVGLGLASLLGQRTVGVVVMIVLEIVLTPIAAMVRIPYMTNLQRAVVGLATAHLEPHGLTQVFGGGGMDNGQSASRLLPESTAVAVCVIVAWLVAWSVLGAWRMMTRDA